MIIFFYIFKIAINDLRGGIKIENQENLGQCPNRGGGEGKKTEMSQFLFGNFENRGRGLYFSKMSQFLLFDSVFCNITFIRNVWNSKMSQFGKRGGVNIFQKCPKGRKAEGGGVNLNPNWDIVPNFLDFLFLHLPLHIYVEQGSRL